MLGRGFSILDLERINGSQARSVSRSIRRDPLRAGSCKGLNGAEVEQVDEPLWEPSALVVFELEAYPEPRSPSPEELRALYRRYKSFYRVAEVIGASEAFARQNAARC